MPPLHTSHVDDDGTFRSRTFLVKYANEIYDMNDGVHFRLTIPDVDISLFHHDDMSITAPEPVTLVFEMYYSEFIKDADNGNASHINHPNYDPDNIVPANPTFTSVASQTLKIPQFLSGLQEYYPIHFDRGSYVQLDMMLHLAATAIRIENIEFEEEDNDGEDDSKSTSTITTTGTASTVDVSGDDSADVDAQDVFTITGKIVKRGPETTTIDTTHMPVQSTLQMLSKKMAKLGKYRPGEGKFRAAMAKKLHMKPSSSSSKSLSSPSSSCPFPTDAEINGKKKATRLSISTSSASFLSSSGFLKSEMDGIYEILYRVLINNQITVERIISFASRIHDVISKSSSQSGDDGDSMTTFFEDSLIGENNDIIDDESHASEVEEARRNYMNSKMFDAVKSKQTVINEMMKLKSTSALSSFLVNKFEEANAETLNRWLTITKILPKITRYMKANLKPRYVLYMRGFWKLSMMVHTCGSSNITRAHVEDDNINKNFLNLLNLETAEARHYKDVVMGLDDVDSSVQLQQSSSQPLLPSSPFPGKSISPSSTSRSSITHKNYHYIFHSALLARNLKVYDEKLELTTTLPYLIFQQYLSPTISVETTHVRAGCLLGCLDEVQLLQPPQQQDQILESTVKFRYACVDNLNDNAAVPDHPIVIQKLSETNPKLKKHKQLPSGAVSLIGSCRISATANEYGTSSSLFSSRRRKSFEISAALTSNQKLAQAAVKGPHLLILQHGFEGSSFDMRALKAHLLFVFPTLNVHCAEGNTNKTYDSIDAMGVRLADDIHYHICRKVSDLQYDGSPGRISFIGHSMGGLIIRRALQEEKMKRYLKKLHVFITLATPHLGTSYAESQLVASGQWAIMKWYKCQSLKELGLDDISSGDIQSSFMYKLSVSKELGFFKRVICFNSPLDMYVPSYSARIQVPTRAELDQVNGQAIIQMAFNMMESIKPENLVRVTLLNCIGKNSREVDKLIGRTAHICYLDNMMVIEEVVHSLIPYIS